VEKNLASQLDRVLVVDCEEEMQIQRLRARDGSTLEEARAILNAQASRTARLQDGAPAGRARCHQE
jgi:dephospho-CoA kinase